MEFNHDSGTLSNVNVISSTTSLISLSSTGGVSLPSGTTAQRPTLAGGLLRYNSETSFVEVVVGNTWANVTQGVPPGGTTGQVLSKNSATDYDVSYVTPVSATSGSAGFMSASDKSKLDGVASGATANSSDATLLNRTNHTGAQAIATVTGLQTALDSKITGTEQTCVKTADQSFNSTTPANVTEMSFTLEANSRYAYIFYLPYRSTNTGTGVSFTLNGPASPTVLAYRKAIPTSATAMTFTTSNAYNVHQASSNTTAANSDQYAELKGVIVTGAAAGTLQLRMSSESTNSVSCRQGACGFLRKL